MDVLELHDSHRCALLSRGVAASDGYTIPNPVALRTAISIWTRILFVSVSTGESIRIVPGLFIYETTTISDPYTSTVMVY